MAIANAASGGARKAAWPNILYFQELSIVVQNSSWSLEIILQGLGLVLAATIERLP